MWRAYLNLHDFAGLRGLELQRAEEALGGRKKFVLKQRGVSETKLEKLRRSIVPAAPTFSVPVASTGTWLQINLIFGLS